MNCFGQMGITKVMFPLILGYVSKRRSGVDSALLLAKRVSLTESEFSRQ